MTPLGALLDDEGARFAVFSRGEMVTLCLLDDDGTERQLPLERGPGDVWSGHVEDLPAGQYYGFRAHGPWDPARGQRFDPSVLLVDPYARAIDRVDGRPVSVLVGDGRDPAPGAGPALPWSDTVIYELHVRGFTRCHPEVSEHQRGTYAGLAHPAVIGHLRDLGVTTVELLPVHEFVSEPALLRRGLTNYWGYNTLGYFAPHGGYSSTGSRGEQVGEFRAMVSALHAAGIEVLLDVVYNHTAEGEADGPTLSWRGLDDAAYYRHLADGSYDDVTGCGNALDLRHHRSLALVTDSLRYWVQEMHVDGFRFDLTTTLARGQSGFDAGGAFLAVIAQDPVLSMVKLVAEPWDLGPGGYQLGAFPPPWLEWNDRFRDAVRSVWLGSRGGDHGRGLRDITYAMSGSPEVFGSRGALVSVNYVTAHDGFTLRDLVSHDHKHNEANGEGGGDGAAANHSWNCGAEGPTDDEDVRALRRRMMRNLLATLTLSSGVPMLTAADEIGRTQRGNNNAYCLDDETSWVSWDLEQWQRDLLDWTRALLAVRRHHPALRNDGTRQPTWFGADGSEMSPEQWLDHGQQVLGMLLPTAAEDGSLLVLLNTGPADAQFVLPVAPGSHSYGVLLDTARERPERGAVIAVGEPAALNRFSVQLLASAR